MSGIYNAPDGQQLHGDGKPVGRPTSGDCITDRIFQQQDEITRLRADLAAAHATLEQHERTISDLNNGVAAMAYVRQQQDADLAAARADVARLREALQNIQPVLAGGLAVIAYNALAATAKP